MSSSPSIVIIEDDEFLLRALSDKMTQEGIVVAAAHNGKEGMDLLKQHSPDLIVLDLLMPEMNGFEVLESIRTTPSLKKIPVIVISNLSQESDIEKAKKLGAVDFLVKSNSSLKEILSRIYTYLPNIT